MAEDKGRMIITQDEIDRHNKEGKGAWLIINNKVYDVESLAMQVRYVHVHVHV